MFSFFRIIDFVKFCGFSNLKPYSICISNPNPYFFFLFRKSKLDITSVCINRVFQLMHLNFMRFHSLWVILCWRFPNAVHKIAHSGYFNRYHSQNDSYQNTFRKLFVNSVFNCLFEKLQWYLIFFQELKKTIFNFRLFNRIKAIAFKLKFQWQVECNVNININWIYNKIRCIKCELV